MTERTLTWTTPDGPMKIFVAEPGPLAGRRRPGVIVLQEAYGVNDHVRGVCRRFAGAGFVAAAPELFHRIGDGVEFGYADWEKIKPILPGITNATLTADLEAAHACLAEHPLVDAAKRLVFGECMGGFASVLAAIRLPVAGAIAFYPGGLNRMRPGIGFGALLDSLACVQCPLLLIYGGKDTGIPPEDVTEVRRQLEAPGKAHDIHVMPEAGHGFCCEARSAYHPASAEKAWALTFDWIRRTIGEPA